MPSTLQILIVVLQIEPFSLLIHTEVMASREVEESRELSVGPQSVPLCS